MTIGIAASGPNAGLAIVRALAAIEKVSWGSIGGYAAYAAIDPASGHLFRAETQRGGSATLFVNGETIGAQPPPAAAMATWAGLMSSGPDRPTPLSQYVPADPAAGLVTGHRLANAVGRSGHAVNVDILGLLRAGCTAQEAVDSVLDANPEADAGIIAIDTSGRLYARNSVRVSRRPDLGHARQLDPQHQAAVEVIHNAIFPAMPLAALAAATAMEVMVPSHRALGYVLVAAGTPVRCGPENRVAVDETGRAIEVVTTDERILTGRHNCAAVYLGALVCLGDAVLGRTLIEPNVMVEGGFIVSLSGQHEVQIAYASNELTGAPR